MAIGSFARSQMNVTPAWCAWSSLNGGEWQPAHPDSSRVLRPYVHTKVSAPARDIKANPAAYFTSDYGMPTAITRRICLLVRESIPYHLEAIGYKVTYQSRETLDFFWGIVKHRPTIKNIRLRYVVLRIDLHSYMVSEAHKNALRYGRLPARNREGDEEEDEQEADTGSAEESARGASHTAQSPRQALYVRSVTRSRSEANVRATSSHSHKEKRLRRRVSEGMQDITHILREEGRSGSRRFYITPKKDRKGARSVKSNSSS